MARNEFGERLRGLRVASGLTIEALAEASGVSVRTVSDTERGRSRAPQRRTIAALAAGLGLGPGDAEAFTALGRSGREPAAPAARPRPFELPRRTAHFVGRDAELAAIGERVAALPPGGPPMVAVLHGPPGVGKTALAVRVAGQHRDRFPDGSYHLDLRGTEAAPVTAGEAQAVLLKALGISSRRIARDEDERAGQLRALLARRRCLLVLDGVAAEAQVRELLPGAGGSCVLVTSRRALAGLEAVLRYGLAPLRPEESAALLAGICGGTVQDIDTVARLCGHLPLALHIAGSRLAARPGWSTAQLVAQLAEPGSGVEAAFAVSYAQLAEPTRTVFRRLAHAPAVPFGAAVAAVLAECDLFAAEEHLEELLDLGLLQPEGGQRYRMHDLIRPFARDRLHAEEPADVRAATARRMTDWARQQHAEAGV